MQSRDIINGLMQELADEDTALTTADRELQAARVRFEVAGQKYAAVRDVVSRHLGRSPYSVSLVHYGVSDRDRNARLGQFPSKARFRFIHMATGDAVAEVLKESEQTMALPQIVEVLVMGGAHHVTATRRAVNAALMRTSGVTRWGEDDESARYSFEVVPEEDS